ncbi:MAG TPA: NACHT domain-containing protein, partial [Anaerolineaceae bacterium]|nr:NACHT domain-containing protein [Anaerolineaceae bacterium]
IHAAEAALPEKARQEFRDILQAELKKIGSQLTITVGDIHHNTNSPINIGSGTQTTTYNIGEQHIHNGPDPEAEKRAAIAQARKRYLTHLRKFCQNLPLAALGGDEGGELGVTLDDVYIELDTTAFIETEDEPGPAHPKKAQTDNRESPDWLLSGQEKPPLPVLQAAGQNPHMVLLGDPGAGKSTFVRKLVGWLAGAVLGDGEPPKGFPAAGLPLLINLRDLAPRLAGVKLDDIPADKQQKKLVAAFTELVQAELKTTQAEALQDDLLAGFSGDGLLVFDGLDEVPFALRQVVRQAVFAVLKTFQPVRVIITCRIRSYQDDFSQSDFKSYTVKPLDEKKITGFASAWYHRQRDLGRTVPQDAESDLARAATGDDLRELSSNPMMLTTMAIIHQKQTRLPDQRVKLYEEAVDILLRRWQQHKQGELSPSEELAKFLKDDTRLRPAMYRLAYAAHCARCQDKKSTTTDLPRGDALLILEDIKYLGDLKLAQEFLDYVDQRAGLLVGRGGKDGAPAAYSFPHRTFQEYLAGCHILELREYNREILSRAAEGVDWSLATQLAAEELYYNRKGKNALLDLAYWLRQHGSLDDPQHQRIWLWSAHQTLMLGSLVAEDGTVGKDHLRSMPD